MRCTVLLNALSNILIYKIIKTIYLTSLELLAVFLAAILSVAITGVTFFVLAEIINYFNF